MFEGYIASDPTYQLKHAIKTIDVTGNKVLYIEIPSANVEDMSLNINPNGLNIGEVKSSALYPSHTNYIPLWTVTAGNRETATDDREDYRLKGTSIDLSDYDGDINAENITVDNIDAQTVVLPDGDVQTQIDTLETLINSTESNLVSVVLGEDVQAGQI